MLTNDIAAFVSERQALPDSASAKEAVRIAFLDTVACILSGRNEEVTRFARSHIGHSHPREARLILSEERARMRDAAFVNAISGHALDLDDMSLSGHPSVVLVPALLAVGETIGASGASMMRAYMVGYEVLGELTAREADQLHEKGWHPTSVRGTVAATAAVANLVGLDRSYSRHAIGIAASMASGLVANFGTMTKPLHAGLAARHACEAVELARAGVTASPDILEHPTGFLTAISASGRINLTEPFVGSLTRWLDKAPPSIKKYPVCYAAHRVIDGVLSLCGHTSITVGNIRSITVTLSATTAKVLRNHQPRTALEAKFSIEFAAAAALIAGAVGFKELTDTFVERDDVQNLLRRVALQQSDSRCPIEPGFAFEDRVVIDTATGERYDSGGIRFARGHAQLPLTDEELKTKFDDCARAGGIADPLPLWQALASLEELDDIRQIPSV